MRHVIKRENLEIMALVNKIFDAYEEYIKQPSKVKG